MARFAAMFACTLGVLAAAPAQASDAGAESTGTVTITVNIPPFAAGLAAQGEGAVGLWTVSTDSSALMLKLPDTLTSDKAADAAIFTNGNTVLDISVDAPSRLEIVRTGSRVDNGLVRPALSLRPLDAALSDPAVPVTMFIRTL
jgi:hypothetical protein